MIYVLSGGGSGCTLVVTGVAGDTCTITNSSTGKSNSKTFDANKQATFKGLATGTWTVEMTGSSGTATRSVTINADYTCTITYFTAIINITYPAASTCVVTNSSGETVASDSNGSASSTKTFTAVVGPAGTYTITSTSSDGANTTTRDVVITTDGQSETVELIYGAIIVDGVLCGQHKIEMKQNSIWTGSGGTNISYKAEGYIETHVYKGTGATYIYPIDCTNFTTLSLDVEYYHGSSHSYATVFYLADKYVWYITGTAPATVLAYKSESVARPSRKTITVPIDKLEGEKYFMISGMDDTDFRLRIYNLTLTK